MCSSFSSQFILSRPMIIWYWMSCERAWDIGGRLWLKGNVVCVHLFQPLHLAHQQFRHVGGRHPGECRHRARKHWHLNKLAASRLLHEVDAAAVGEGVGTDRWPIFTHGYTTRTSFLL